MSMLQQIRHGEVMELRLDRPPFNALNPALVSELLQALQKTHKSEARAIILSGSPGVFSVGVDAAEVLSLNRAETQHFFVQFHDLCVTLGRSPIPVVAAITGHAPAAGAILALFCDYRIMARGLFQIGLHQVKMGIIVPTPIRYIMSRLVGPRLAERLLVEGQMLNPEEAHRIGLVDETAPPEAVLHQALQHCQRLLALPAAAMNAVRDSFHEEMHHALENRDAIIDELIENWFSEEAQDSLRTNFSRMPRAG
ncbi:MAG: enoyl-CoA hydratase/isomerase family protein [Nevskiales bacterium]